MRGLAAASSVATTTAPDVLESTGPKRWPEVPSTRDGLHVDIEVDRRPHRVRAAFAVAPSERLALFGPSGAGKTTILEVIAGLTRPDRGTVTLDDRLLTTDNRRSGIPLADRRVGLLRQPPGLFPHLTVEENAFYGCQREVGADERRLLAALGLDRHRRARPVALSGGQRQRVALARVLLGPFAVLLLDEPFTGLDAAVRAQVSRCVRERAAARHAPVLLVTHDLAEAQAFSDRLGIIDDGRLLQVGHPHEVVAHPASRRVAEMVGYRGFVPAASAGAGGGLLCVHPDRIRLGEHPEAGVVLCGTVAAVRPCGAGFEADLALPGGDVVTCGLPPHLGETGIASGRSPGDVPNDLLRCEGHKLTVTALDPPRVAIEDPGEDR